MNVTFLSAQAFDSSFREAAGRTGMSDPSASLRAGSTRASLLDGFGFAVVLHCAGLLV
jgi:hypothetical protein